MHWSEIGYLFIYLLTYFERALFQPIALFIQNVLKEAHLVKFPSN